MRGARASLKVNDLAYGQSIADATVYVVGVVMIQ